MNYVQLFAVMVWLFNLAYGVACYVAHRDAEHDLRIMHLALAVMSATVVAGYIAK